MALGTTSLTTDFGRRGIAHAHPMYDFLTGFLPRKLKDLFRWCEYLYYRSPQIFRAAQRLADYAITDIEYLSGATSVRNNYRDLLEEHMGIKSVLKRAQRDRIVYGNGIYSLYFPTKKMVACEKCRVSYDLSKLEFDYGWKKMTFAADCPRCGRTTTHKLSDIQERRSWNRAQIRVIPWDPKLIDIEYNPVSGQKRFYYNIPTSVRTEIERGNTWFISQLPIGFLEAVGRQEIFRFSPGAIFHLAEEGPSGLQAQWGLPPLTSVMKDFFYAGSLRKANEAIALEYLLPFRVLSPDIGGGNMVRYLSMGNWKNNIMQEYRQWRRDQLHFMTAPVPVRVTQVGGQGRALLTTPEVEQAENNIMAGMGVPREFIYGGLQFTGSAVTLRILENQLLNDARGLRLLLRWVVDRVRRHMGWPRINVNLKPFRFIDDVSQKGLLLQADSAYQFLSRTSAAELFERDMDLERERKVKERVDDLKMERTLAKHEERAAGIAAQAEQAAQAGASQMGGEEMFIMQAQQMTEQLLQMSYEDRKSMLYSLRGQSQVLYALVTQMLSDVNREEEQVAKSQVRQQRQV